MVRVVCPMTEPGDSIRSGIRIVSIDEYLKEIEQITPWSVTEADGTLFEDFLRKFD